VDWINLAQDMGRWRAVVNTVMNLWVPEKAGNFLTSRATISFSRRTLLHGFNSVGLLVIKILSKLSVSNVRTVLYYRQKAYVATFDYSIPQGDTEEMRPTS
jgi:hypothetical protein